MPARKKTKAQVKAQLKRAMESLNKRSDTYPNIPRSEYNLQQQTAYVKTKSKKGGFNFSTRNVNRMIDFADNQENKREQQLKDAAAKVLASING